MKINYKSEKDSSIPQNKIENKKTFAIAIKTIMHLGIILIQDEKDLYRGKV